MTHLSRVRWLGGGSGAGKTTVARVLADRYGLSIYDTDATIHRHAAAAEGDAPLLDAFLRMDADERWVDRDPDLMFATFPWFAGERFELIIRDLDTAPDGIHLAEGFRLLPRLVAPLLTEPWHAVWLTPTPEFRAAAFAARAEHQQFWLGTTDPDTALRQVLRRDEMFTEVVRREVSSRGLKVVEQDGTRTPDDVAGEIAAWFRLARRDAGRADTARGR